MDNTNGENENIAISRNLSHKFEFYLIALVFTILGLSIQTASLSGEYFQYIFEFLAWVSLLVSGLAGLWRLEWVPVAYRQVGSQQIEEKNLNAFNEGLSGRIIIKESGDEWLPEELKEAKSRLESHIYKRKDKINEIEKSIALKYQIHKYAFIIGMISLFVSRVLAGLSTISAK